MSSLDPARVERLKSLIRDVPDFPKPGIVFKDITPLLMDPEGLRDAGKLLALSCADARPDKVIAIESRGFILGSLVAAELGIGFVPVRKPGKLPARSIRASYALEYGTDSLEMHADALAEGERVAIVDDVIATGGTARAVAELAESLGASVAVYAFLIELGFLNGRAKLEGYEVRSLIRY
jgi:adenine phosphoribosyltransferase